MKNIFAIIAFLVLFRLFFFYIEQKSLYYPLADITLTPESLGINYQQVNIKTPDNQIINGWFVPAEGAKLTILYFHGNAGNISHRVHRVDFFHQLGVNLFIFDYRGYGKSTGKPQEKQLYADAVTIFDYLVTRPDVDKNNIIVYGKSLGGAIAAELALNREAYALIIESSFASVTKRAQQLYWFLPMRFLISQKYNTVNKIRKINIPKLIVHGRRDDVIGFEHGEILFKAAMEPKQFLAFDGAHNNEIYVTSADYAKQLNQFLDN